MRTGIIAALLMMLILLTGTYAWTQFNNIGFSAVDLETNFGGRFHNNFQWANESGQGTHNKNLFAENFGNNQIFVRARLREFLRAGEGSDPIGHTTEYPVLLNNPATWPIYQAQDNDVRVRRFDSDSRTIENRGITWTLGHTDGSMYFMPTFNRANREITNSPLTGLTAPWDNILTQTNHTFADQMIEASGDAVDARAGGFEMGDVTDVRQIRAQGSQTSPLRSDNEPSDGSRNFWAPGGVPAESALTPILEIDEATGNLIQGNPVTHTARQTNMPMTTPEGESIASVPAGLENGVMTFAQWHEANMPTGHFWVMDAYNGWFYYAMPLQGGQATSMLLSEIIVDDIRDEGIEYVVHVEAEFAIRSRIPIEMSDITEDVALLWGEVGYEVTIARNEGSLEIERETPTPAGDVTVERLSILGDGSTSIQVQTPPVIWAIEGPTSNAGALAPTGITVDANTGEVMVTDEAVGGVGVAYVVATMIMQNGERVAGRRRIDVLQFIPAIENLNPHETFTVPGSDTEWRVLLPDDGDGNALIITEHVHGWDHNGLTEQDRRFNTVAAFRTFEGSVLQDTMNIWFDHIHLENANVGTQIRSASLNYEFQNNEGETVVRQNAMDNISAGIEMDWTIATGPHLGSIATLAAQQPGPDFLRAVTRPERGSVGNGELFPLSLIEVQIYFAPDGVGIAGENGIAQRVDSTNTNTAWWLRSAGTNATRVRAVSVTGNFHGSLNIDGGTDAGFRPALWVRR